METRTQKTRRVALLCLQRGHVALALELWNSVGKDQQLTPLDFS